MGANLRTETEIRSDIAVWETARTNSAQGRSITIVTSAGTRVVSANSVSEIQGVLNRLYGELNACLVANATEGNRQGLHDFALANMGDNGANQ